MYLTKELALNMESCIQHTHIEMARSVPWGRVLDLGDGAACFAGSSSFFSQVIGWGFHLNRKQFKTQITAIEDFYRSLGHQQVHIELCPLVGIDVAMALSERGYAIDEWNNVSYIDLTRYVTSLEKSVYHLREVDESYISEWANKVALGFGHMQAQEQFYRYARLKHVHAFAAYEGNQIIAGASVAIHDGIADLGVTSTLEPYRGQGLQKLLIHHRLQYVAQLNIPLAIVTTEPGSISDLNVQKAGFQCAYTRIKLSKNF